MLQRCERRLVLFAQVAQLLKPSCCVHTFDSDRVLEVLIWAQEMQYGAQFNILLASH